MTSVEDAGGFEPGNNMAPRYNALFTFLRMFSWSTKFVWGWDLLIFSIFKIWFVENNSFDLLPPPSKYEYMAWKTACRTSRMPEALKLLIQWQVGGVGGEGRGGGRGHRACHSAILLSPEDQFSPLFNLSTCSHWWALGNWGAWKYDEKRKARSHFRDQSINQSINQFHLDPDSRDFTKINTVLNLQIFWLFSFRLLQECSGDISTICNLNISLHTSEACRK